MLAVSCDRHLDNADDEFVLAMGAAEGPTSAHPYDVMVHLGDQIYADSLFARLKTASFKEVRYPRHRCVCHRLGCVRLLVACCCDGGFLLLLLYSNICN